MAHFREWLPEDALGSQPGRVRTELILEDDGAGNNVVYRQYQDVEPIFDANKRLASHEQRGHALGLDAQLAARIPDVIYHQWKREWAQGPQLWGVPWDEFRNQKLRDPDNAFCVVKKGLL